MSPKELQEANRIATRAGLRITSPRPSVWNLFRSMPDRLVFIGQRVSPAALLALTKKVARIE